MGSAASSSGEEARRRQQQQQQQQRQQMHQQRPPQHVQQWQQPPHEAWGSSSTTAFWAENQHLLVPQNLALAGVPVAPMTAASSVPLGPRRPSGPGITPVAIPSAPAPAAPAPRAPAPSGRNPATESDESVRACSRFRLTDLQEATTSFSEDNVVGEGGFGKVFRGILLDGTSVAVKQLNPRSLQGDREFYAEVALLMRLRHPNLVGLMGMCTEGGQRLLVFEYMERGSLREILDKRPASLGWKERIGIALGAARGLAFLHCITEPVVVHCDFKAANVLIDAHGTARVADFGLARHISVKTGNRGPPTPNGTSNADDVTTVTSIRGTFGYLSPEYLEKGHASVLADVFAYGVVMLELMTGLQVIDSSRGKGMEGLADWMRPKLGNQDEVAALLDPNLASQHLPLLVQMGLCEIVEGCVQIHVRERPNMLEVVRALTAVAAHLEGPN